MKVRMTTLAAGPQGVWPAGQEVEIPDAQAVQLIEAGYAEPVRKRREMATVEPAEKAILLVTAVEGIDGAWAKELMAIGIETAAELAAAESDLIAEAIGGVGLVTAKKWIEKAKELTEA